MSRRRRALVLTLLALAVPLPAYALTNEVLAPSGPSSITVSASLGDCGVLEDGIACQINVSFSEVANAASYTAAVTRADGSVVDYGTVSPGGTSIWVPYVGAGTYSVKVTAYGEPETPADSADGHGEVIATGYSAGEQADGDRSASDRDGQGEVATDAGSRDPGAAVNADPDGAATTDATDSDAAPEGTTTADESTTTTPETTCTAAAATAAPTPPEEPPADLDPENPDEDADGIPDEQERATYEQQLAEYQAAVAAQAPPGC